MRFSEFWPAYLRAHRHPSTRIAHYIATFIGLGGVAAAVVARVPLVAIICILLAYGIAVTSHRIFEHGRSMVTVNPVWGALADLRMCWLALRGVLPRELKRNGCDAPASRPAAPARAS
jgi:hypothetical protein